MKVGIRTPSLSRRIAARTSWKRFARHSLGLKAPHGWGWVTNPQRAAYNRVYDRTTVSVDQLLRSRRRRHYSGGDAGLLLAILGVLAALVALLVGAATGGRRRTR